MKMSHFPHSDLFRNHTPPHQNSPQRLQLHCLRLRTHRHRQNLHHDRESRDIRPQVHTFIPSVLAIRDIFYYIDKDPDNKYDVLITYVEIYN